MKILHILDISLPHRQSGYSLRSQYIVNAQKALGFDPIALTRLGAPADGQCADGVEYIEAWNISTVCPTCKIPQKNT